MSNIHSTPLHVTPPIGIGASGEFWGSDGAGGSAWSIPTGVTFDPNNTVYFAPVGGSDTNTGLQNSPYQTLARAITRFNELIDDGANFVQVIGLGIGIDTSNISITRSGLYLYAPGIQHNPTAGTALTVNIVAGGASYINVLLASSAVAGGSYVLNMINYVGGSDSVVRFTYLGRAFGDVYLAHKCEFNATTINTLTALEAGTNVSVQYGIGSMTNQTRLNLEGMAFGANGVAIYGPTNVTDIWRYPMRKPVYLAGDITLGFPDSGYLYINDTANDYTITLPDTAGQGTPAFLLCYEATFLNLSTGSISFAAGGAASLVGTTSINQPGQRINCSLVRNNVWEADLVPVGKVNSGTANQMAYYAATGSTVSGLATANNGILVTSGAGVPSISSTLPAAVQDNITRVGALVSGSLSTGFTTVAIAQGGTGVTSVTTAPTATAFAGWDANKNLSANAFAPGYTSTATAGGTTTLTVASTQEQFFTGTLAQTVVMPVTSTLVQGQFFVINNASTVSPITVNSSGGNLITSVNPGASATVTCVLTSGTTAASWFVPAAASSLPATTISLPLTAFNYYNRYLDAGTELWFQTIANNGTFTAGTLNQDMGTVNLNLVAGTWRITVVAFPDTTNGGIINFNFNSATTSVDTFIGTQVIPYTWETTIAADGTYGFQIINNGKNAGSSGYNMNFGQAFISLAKIA